MKILMILLLGQFCVCLSSCSSNAIEEMSSEKQNYVAVREAVASHCVKSYAKVKNAVIRVDDTLEVLTRLRMRYPNTTIHGPSDFHPNQKPSALEITIKPEVQTLGDGEAVCHCFVWVGDTGYSKHSYTLEKEGEQWKVMKSNMIEMQ